MIPSTDPKTCQNETAPPLATVVIPCYRQAGYLPEAVESVVAQSFRNWELVIVNDGSQDNTSEVARRLIARHADCQIRLVEKANGGLADARNTGILGSRGKYFLPLDADDRIAPNFLQKAVEVLGDRPEVGFVYSDIQHFGGQHDVYRLPDFDAETMIHADNVACGCALVRRCVWEDVGGYRLKEGYEDWDFWVGCIEKGWSGYRIPEVLFFYRKTTTSMLSDANVRRERLIARIVTGHPALYSARRVRQAQCVLEGCCQEARSRRVLLACTHFWPSVGGLETVAENLGSRLVKLGYQVDVATLVHPQRAFHLYRGVKIIQLSPRQRRGNQLPQAAGQLRGLVESGDYDACILLADPLNWVLWSLEGTTVPRNTRIIAQPLINADGYGKWQDRRVFRQRLSGILKACDAVIAISTDGPEVQFFRAERIPFVYVPNAVENVQPSRDFRERFGLPPGVKLFLHVANLWPVKNHLGLMRALESMPGEWRLVMIGQTSGDAEYAGRVREAAAKDERFLLIPGLPREDVAAAMRAADVVLLASLGEVSPLTILEAMSHGKPWLATPACGAVHDNAGGLVAPLDEFPALLCKLDRDPAVAQELGRLGQEHWRTCYQWEHVIHGWDQLIRTGRIEVPFSAPARIEYGMKALRAGLGRPEIVPGCDAAPKVSIIVPTYNRPEMLREALQSILDQTLQDFEIIVINDGGIDIAPVIGAFNAGQKIVHLRHATNRDRAAARNTGLRIARGKYIAYLDDDDIFYSHHLETLVKFAEARGAPVVYSDAYCATQASREGRCVVTRRHVLYSNDFDCDQILSHNLTPVLCVLHERACLDKAGSFDEALTTHEDWDMWIRISQYFRFAHLREITCEFRSREDGTSTTSSRRSDFYRTARIIYAKYQACVAGKPAVRKAQRAFLAFLARRCRGVPWHRIFGRWIGELGRRMFFLPFRYSGK